MNGRHRTFIVIASVVAILSLFLSYPVAPAEAQQAARVTLTGYKVQTIDGRDTKEPLMAGSSYLIEFALQIPKDVRDTITLETDLKLVGNQYWALPTDYKGINLQTVVPARRQIAFSAEFEGKPKFTLTGAVPEDLTSVKDNSGKVIPGIHLKKPVRLLILSSASGTIKDERRMEAIDKSIETYQNTLAAKREVVESQSGEENFINIIRSLVKEAQTLAAAGYTDSATSLLKAIPDKGWPQPPTSNTLLYLVIGVVALVAVFAFFLVIKSRGASSYARNVIEDQVKRLDVVSVKAGRLGDKPLVQEINAVKDELDRISR